LKSDALETIPGVGRSIADDLRALGYRSAEDLAGEDPEAMYQRLCDLRGERIDRCVLYVFRCAVYCTSTPNPDPDLTQWWKWKDR
jgi:hypothetical protein